MIDILRLIWLFILILTGISNNGRVCGVEISQVRVLVTLTTHFTCAICAVRDFICCKLILQFMSKLVGVACFCLVCILNSIQPSGLTAEI
jgi:hypothetical protein